MNPGAFLITPQLSSAEPVLKERGLQSASTFQCHGPPQMVNAYSCLSLKRTKSALR